MIGTRNLGATISGDIHAGLAALETAYEDLARTHRVLVAELKDLDTRLQKHLNEWTGDARSAYEAGYADWWARVAAMSARLHWLSKVLNTAQHNFGNAHHANGRIWRRA